MLERSRTKAIDTYTFYIRYYALLGLRKRIETSAKAALKGLLTTKTKDRPWEHERRILVSEFGTGASLGELLEELSDAMEQIAVNTQISKEKDDSRGERIIDDYPHAHAPAAEDKFVRKTWAETRALKADIAKLVRKVGKN